MYWPRTYWPGGGGGGGPPAGGNGRLAIADDDNEILQHQQQVPTDQLQQHILQRAWDLAAHRLHSHPSDVCYFKDIHRHHQSRLPSGTAAGTSTTTTTVLHRACQYRAPHDLIVQLCRCPAADTILTRQDSDGWTPLHVQLLYGRHDATTVHMIERGGAAAATVQSPLVGAALHLACRHGSSRPILQALVRVAPHMVTSTTMAPPATAQFAATLLYKTAQKQQQCNTDVLDRLFVLVAAVYDYESVCTAIIPPLHVVIDFCHRFAPDTNFVRIYVDTHPRSVSVRFQHQLPIHVAAALDHPDNRQLLLPSHHSVDPLLLLVQRAPHTAHLIDPVSGQYVLHTVLCRRRPAWNTIEGLVRVAPQQVDRIDQRTQLYAFQLAATAAVAAQQSSSSKSDSSSLATIFQLLKRCPHVLAMACAAQGE